MSNWQAQSLRLTIFRSAPIDQVVPLLENLTGEKPTKVDSQPRDNIIREEGPTILGTLVHVSNPIRIDWHLIPSQEQQQKAVAFPMLGSVAEVKSQFFKLMSDWLTSDNVPEIKRMALGVVALMTSNSRESAYKQLSTFLPHVELDIENSTDFSYHINRPIKSSIEPDLVINRLSKWNALQTIGFGVFLDERPEVIKDTREHFASRLELDINTSQYYDKIFSKGRLTEILQELNELGEKILSEGDR